MKKIISILTVFAIITYMIIPINADTKDSIQPLWDNIRNFKCTLNFDGTEGTAAGTVYGKTGTTQISATLVVYKKLGPDNWEYIDHTGTTTTNSSLIVSLDFPAEPGAYYRAIFTVMVVINGVEEIDKRTVYKTCPSEE